MRFPAFLAVTAAVFLSIPAFAQDRVVGDTFKDDRAAHQETIAENARRWDQEYRDGEEKRQNARKIRDMERKAHQMHMDTLANNWKKDWEAGAEARAEKKAKWDEENKAHQEFIASKPQEWWYGDAGLNQ